MASTCTYNLTELQRLAQGNTLPNITIPPPLKKLTNADVPYFATAADESRAEQLLLKQKASKLHRAPSIRTKRRRESYEFKNATASLPEAVRDNESVGVIQALLRKAGDASIVKKAETRDGLVEQRESLLQQAAQSENVELVWLLAPQSSQARRNAALETAFGINNEDIVLKLLEYDADPNSCSDQFKTAAARGDYAAVSLLLRSPRAIQSETLLESVSGAVKSGSLPTLTLIAQIAPLHRLQELPALLTCIKSARLDMLCTLLLRTRSISSPYLDSLVLTAVHISCLDVNAQARLLEALFSAGASGSHSAEAFSLVVSKRATKLIDVFAQHHTDINWNRGVTVKLAVKQARSDILKSVIASGGLSVDNASRAMTALPAHVEPSERFRILKILLDAGAYGSEVDDQLVFAVQRGDQDIISLLRDRGASLDRNQGTALVEAVKNGRMDTITLLLRGPVDQESMTNAFPQLRFLDRSKRLQMTKLLLNANASGQAVDVALRDAVCDRSADRDLDLIHALIEVGADPAFNDAQCLRESVSFSDANLLKDLLKCPAQVSQGVASLTVRSVTAVNSAETRHKMLQHVIDADARTSSLSEALESELSRKNLSYEVVDMLLFRGNASVDHDGGESMVLCALKHELKFLSLLMRSPNLSRATVNKGLLEMLRSPTLDDDEKASRTKELLAGRRNGLKAYVDYCHISDDQGREWPLNTFRVLLNMKADVGMANGEVFISVVAVGAVSLLKLMAQHDPPKAAIDGALLQALNIAGDKNRSEIFQILLKLGPSVQGTSTAMVKASEYRLLKFVEMLHAHGALTNYQDHRAIRIAASNGDVGLLQIFLKSTLSQSSLTAAFEEAETLDDDGMRLKTLRAILDAPFNDRVVSLFLIRILEESTTSYELVQMLVDHDVSVREQRNRSVILAATSRKLDILKLLFTKVDLPEVATQCFEACIWAGMIRTFDVEVLQFLLEMGAAGRCLDQALLEAVQRLQQYPNNDTTLVQLLVSYGADANYDNGYALCCACEMGKMEAVRAIVRSNPSTRSRSRALHHLMRSNAVESAFSSIVDMLMSDPSPNAEDLGSSMRPTLLETQNEFDHPIRVFLKNRARDALALRKLFHSDCGISVRDGRGDVLFWALNLTDSRVSTPCIQTLVELGANANQRDLQSGDTVILRAIKTGRSALISTLIKYGADASVTDAAGCSPLFLASNNGNDRAVSDILAAGVLLDDGSLHQAARNLKIETIKLLLNHGFSPDKPSSMHGGRTALEELFLNGRASRANYTLIKKVIDILCDAGAGVTVTVGRKPLICLALDNADPRPMTEAVLTAYLWTRIDEDFNVFNDGHYCYSPTRYVSKGLFLGPQNQASELEDILKRFGAKKDVFYIPDAQVKQPPDAEGMPEPIRQAAAERRAKEADEAKKEADHQRVLQRNRDLENQQQNIADQQHRSQLARNAEIEMQRQEFQQTQHDQQIAQQQERQAEDRAQQHEREAEWNHRINLDNAETAARKERYRLEADNRKQILYEEAKASDYRISSQSRWARDQDAYQERQHERRMRELTIASAVPIGPPYLPAPTRGGFITDGT